jgi:enoyl-CoA hydratase/carnithine racemase
MQYKQIKLEIEQLDAGRPLKIAILTLNKPDKFNAIGPRMALELDNVVDEIRHLDPDAVILTGAGKNFCAGGDLKVETLSLERPEDRLGLPENEYADLFLWWLNDHFHVVLQRAYEKFERLPMPMIAAIDGIAVGIGFELTLACDLRVMTKRARVAEIAVPVGFLSEWSATRTLAQLIGASRATEMILSGRFVSAEEAQSIGLAHQVVDDDGLAEAAMETAIRIARQPRLGVRYAKEEIRHYLSANRTREGFDLELARILEITRSEDSIEGVRAFNSKRPPRWQKGAP